MAAMQVCTIVGVALVLAIVGLVLPGGLRDQAEGVPCPDFPRPPYTDYAHMARWLVHQTTWGVVSTTSQHLGGVPFGNVLSHADGPSCEPTGRILLYLSPMDATMQDLAANSSASLALAEAQLVGACRGVDPEDPTCAKLTLSGSLEPVPDEAVEEAERLLFPRHPDMPGWPSGHGFRIHELRIRSARLLDWYGGPHDITVEDYFAAQLQLGHMR